MAHCINKALFASLAFISISAQAELQNPKVTVSNLNIARDYREIGQTLSPKANIVFSEDFNKTEQVDATSLAIKMVKILKDNKDTTKVAHVNGKLCSLLVVSPNGTILYLDVRVPKNCNQDFGYELLEKIIESSQELAEKNNVPRLNLYIRRNKTSEIEFFKKCGFEVTADAGADTIYMSKVISDKQPHFVCGTEILDRLRNNPVYAKNS